MQSDQERELFTRDWEKVDGVTYRMRVFGGWLVKAVEPFTFPSSNQVCERRVVNLIPAITFIPDPSGEWVLKRRR